jgi:hypothetical protein
MALFELLQQYRREYEQEEENEDGSNRQEGGAIPVPEGFQNLQIPLAVQSKIFRNHEAAARDENKRGNCKYRNMNTTVKSSLSPQRWM